MLPNPRADLTFNTADFERLPLVKPTGFREYDARWLFPAEVNLMGLNAIGLCLATLAHKRGRPKRSKNAAEPTTTEASMRSLVRSRKGEAQPEADVVTETSAEKEAEVETEASVTASATRDVPPGIDAP